MKRNILIGAMGLIWAIVGAIQLMHDDIKSAALYGVIAVIFFIALILKKGTKE